MNAPISVDFWRNQRKYTSVGGFCHFHVFPLRTDPAGHGKLQEVECNCSFLEALKNAQNIVNNCPI